MTKSRLLPSSSDEELEQLTQFRVRRSRRNMAAAVIRRELNYLYDLFNSIKNANQYAFGVNVDGIVIRYDSLGALDNWAIMLLWCPILDREMMFLIEQIHALQAEEEADLEEMRGISQARGWRRIE